SPFEPRMNTDETRMSGNPFYPIRENPCPSVAQSSSRPTNETGFRTASEWLDRSHHRYIHFYVSRLAVDCFIEAKLLMHILHPHDRDAVDDPEHAISENKGPHG